MQVLLPALPLLLRAARRTQRGDLMGFSTPGTYHLQTAALGHCVLLFSATVAGWRCHPSLPSPSLPSSGLTGSQHLQPRGNQLKIGGWQQGSPVCGKLWAAGWACGAILRGLRDYSWPVNIDSASSGATAQLGRTVFRARREARRAAESGALSRGGRGQGEDVSSVICSERLREQLGRGAHPGPAAG